MFLCGLFLFLDRTWCFFYIRIFSIGFSKSVVFIFEYFLYVVDIVVFIYGFRNCGLEGLRYLFKGIKFVRGILWFYFKDFFNFFF